MRTEEEIRIRRIWSMPSRWTFSVGPIKELIEKYLPTNGSVIIDPFVGKSIFADRCTATNDLNPDCVASHHLEALDFLRTFADASVDFCFFDPPFSPRQISECYKSVGLAVHMKETQKGFYTERKREVARIVKPGGIVVTCGWNSGGIGLKNGFSKLEILMVPHGAGANDTIVTVERKVQAMLNDKEEK
jgi:hypothetical protein